MLHLLTANAQSAPATRTPAVPASTAASAPAKPPTEAARAAPASSTRPERAQDVRAREFSLPTTGAVIAVERLVLAAIAAYFVCGVAAFLAT
jgi:hypothetical protein